MKNLFIFLTLIFSISANAEFNSFESFQDVNQEGKIEAAYIDMLSSGLREAKEAYQKKLDRMPETYSDTEGKIQASIINMIDTEFDTADALFKELAFANAIDDASTKELRDTTTLIFDLIKEL
jgi:hypothetical protein